MGVMAEVELAGRAAESVPVAVPVAVLFKAPVAVAVIVPFKAPVPVAVAVAVAETVPFKPTEPVAVEVAVPVAVPLVSPVVPLNLYKLNLQAFPHISTEFPVQGMEQSPSHI